MPGGSERYPFWTRARIFFADFQADLLNKGCPVFPSFKNLTIGAPSIYRWITKALNKYLTPLYSLKHSIQTLLSASKPSINQSSSLYFPVGAQKQFLSMVPSITDYVSSNVQSCPLDGQSGST